MSSDTPLMGGPDGGHRLGGVLFFSSPPSLAFGFCYGVLVVVLLLLLPSVDHCSRAVRRSVHSSPPPPLPLLQTSIGPELFIVEIGATA